MAPPKRKTQNDDFVFTLSDGDESLNGNAPPAPKRAKIAEDGADDDEMDPDFEFPLNDGTETADLDGWDFGGAAKGADTAPARSAGDIDDIIRRRKATNGSDGVQDGAEVDEREDDESLDGVDLDDDEDEVLAADAFGMDVSKDDDDGSIESRNEDADDAASDDDSVATPLNHPDDVGSSQSSDDEVDVEEKARQEAFFAATDDTPQVTRKPGASSFLKLSLSRPILRGLNSLGFSTPTPIQAKAIPIALEGKDVVGGAVTGSGKTAAFMVPILERLFYRPNKIPTTRVVVLTPTRELAIQCHSVATKLASYTDIKITLAVGGLSVKAQEMELKLRPDIIIATPGRFIDHMRNSQSFAVDTVEIVVLDEADRMLEDGFADELNEILATLPKKRQTMLFSATMTSSVDRLIRAGLHLPVRIMVDEQKKTVKTLVQEFVRLRPGREDKRMAYLVHICRNLYTNRVLIFFRQKKTAHVARIVFGLMGLSCAELHGSMNQTQRIASMEAFRDRKVAFLIATDVASRGLDIKAIDTVINYEAPQNLEIYVHRVGRTARAGRTGVALTLAAESDRKVVKAAVKAAKKQNAKVVSRTIDPAVADKLQVEIDGLEDEIAAIMIEEKQEKQLAQVEMQVKKGENMIRYEDEIKSKPKRTWFESEKEKKKARELGRDELNGFREKLKSKHGGKGLSNKDRKKLDAKAERKAGRFGGRGDKDRMARPARSAKRGGRGGKRGGSKSRK